MRDYGPLARALERHDGFLLTSHLFPDADGLGSALALAGGLRKLGKQVRIVVPSPVPERYWFLDPAGEVEHWTREMNLVGSRTVVVLDCSIWSRLAGLGQALAAMPMAKIVVDHHKDATAFADVSLLDVNASATAEMIYELLTQELGVELDATMAQALYAAIASETGGFQFSNTTSRVHRIAAELLDLGVSADRVNIELNQRNPPRSIRFLARSLETFRTAANGRIAWVAVGMDIFAETGATADDTIGLVAYPRSIEGVELALMFFEDEPNRTKISFRAKTDLDVAEFAKQFGGGGHAKAAGAMIEKGLEEAVEMVVMEGERLFSQRGARGESGGPRRTRG